MLTEQASALKFGTDGWRAVIARDFTFDNVALVAQALAETWKAETDNRLAVVGFDTRFLSDKFARTAAEVLAANGFEVVLADRACSSPSISWAVKERGAVGAVMITASHNPPEYNGFKIKAHYGGSASPELTAKVETVLRKGVRPAPYRGEAIATFDPRAGYFAQLAKLVDLGAIAKAGLQVIADPMYGAGSGYLRTMLEGAGMSLTELHAEANPSFHGTNPEPIAPNLVELAVRTREAANTNPLTVGLAFDGDADRIGAVDADGTFVNSHRILALMLQHLVETKGWKGGVIRTFSTSRLIEKLAKAHDLPLFETPIGFKYICDLMVSEDILIGGEESGGIGIKNHIPERDGILCGLMLLEIMATHKATLGELVARLEARYGAHEYDRIDLHLADNSAKDRVLAGLKAEPPVAFAGQTVSAVETLDGVKFSLDHGGWLLFRASGTEPLLRIYAEAPSMALVRALLEAGRTLAQGA